MATVHIIGAGISGLSAATALAEKHIPVKLYEATAYAGGRCRTLRDKQFGAVDNGLHTISPGDAEFNRYITRIGMADAVRPVSEIPLPAAPLVDYLPFFTWLAGRGQNASQALTPQTLLRDAWYTPFARLRLGTLPATVPMSAMRRPLWKYLRLRERKAAPSLDAYIQPALDYLDYHGGSIYFSHTLNRIEQRDGTPIALVFPHKKVALEPDDILILATPPAVTQPFLPNIDAARVLHSAMTLHYRTSHRESESHHYPIDAPVDQLRYSDTGISAMIRPADAVWHSDDDFLAERIWSYLRARHTYLREQPMPECAIAREKRAGHALEDRAAVPADHGRIVLAGDWLDPLTPASLEAAAANGHRAALLALSKLPPRPERDQQRFYLKSSI